MNTESEEDRMVDRPWRVGPPTAPGVYQVRPRREDFLDGTGIDVPRVPVRVVEIRAGDARFDAGVIAGFIASPCWEWNGPFEFPDFL